MQLPTQFQRNTLSLFILILICLLQANNAICRQIDKGSEKTSGNFKSEHKIYGAIKVGRLHKAIAKTKNKKVIIDIYPIKRSNNIHIDDFGLQNFFQDTQGSKVDIGERIDLNTFTRQSTNYINFLKREHIISSDIPNGYYIEIDADRIKNIDEIGFYLSVEKSHMDCYFLSKKVNQLQVNGAKQKRTLRLNGKMSTVFINNYS